VNHLERLTSTPRNNTTES